VTDAQHVHSTNAAPQTAELSPVAPNATFWQVISSPRLMANFAATFSQQAGLLLSKPLTVRPALAARRSAGEFLASVEATSCCYALHPLSNGDSEHSVHQPAGWVEIAPGVALAMIDLLLGGLQAGQQIPSRPLTEIERRLLLRVVQVAAAAMIAVPEVEARTIRATRALPSLGIPAGK